MPRAYVCLMFSTTLQHGTTPALSENEHKPRPDRTLACSKPKVVGQCSRVDTLYSNWASYSNACAQIQCTCSTKYRFRHKNRAVWPCLTTILGTVETGPSHGNGYYRSPQPGHISKRRNPALIGFYLPVSSVRRRWNRESRPIACGALLIVLFSFAPVIKWDFKQ